MLAAGFTDYLPKSVNIGQMEEMMVRYLPKELVERIEPEPSGETEEERELAKLPEPQSRSDLLRGSGGLSGRAGNLCRIGRGQGATDDKDTQASYN